MRIKDVSKEILIRQKAIEIIVKFGLARLNMKDLALACDISASTIYVYYMNKSDLIYQLSLWLRTDILQYSLKGLTPEMTFTKGLLLQWNNRFQYFIKCPQNILANEQLRYTNQYQQASIKIDEKVNKTVLKGFLAQAIKNGELAKIPTELYWSIAFSPLYKLIEFQVTSEKSVSKPFKITPSMIKKTVNRISLSLKK